MNNEIHWTIDGSNYKLVENYKGFAIVQNWHRTYGTDYFYIAKDGERFSWMYLASPKACKNVIDTHMRNKKVGKAKELLDNYLQSIEPIYVSYPIKKTA